MRKILRKFFSSKITFFLVATTIILALNLTPSIAHIRHAPSGRTFALIHNNTQDFFFYQALMNQGAQGNWLTSDPYTTETHQPSLIFSYFLWLGKLSKILGLPYAVTYHLVRIILSVFFLFSIFYFLFSIPVPYPRLTYLLFLFASPFMHKAADGSIVPYMNWWTGMDAIRRAAYLPHHMAGSLLLVITVILLLNHVKSKIPGLAARTGKNQKSKIQFKIQNYKYLLYAILLAPILAFIHTPSLLIVLLVLPTSIFYFLLSNTVLLTAGDASEGIPRRGSLALSERERAILNRELGTRERQDPQILLKIIIGLLVYWLISFFLLLFMVFQTQRGFPWSQYIEWEKNLQFPLDRELIGALGVLFPFAALGAISALKTRRFENILITSWLFVPLLLIPFAQRFNLSNIRLIQGVPYLPLAILAVLGLSFLEKILSSIILSVKSKIPGLAARAGKYQKSKIHIKNKIADISRSNVKFSQRTHGIVNYISVKEVVDDNKTSWIDSAVAESTHLVSKKSLHASEIGIRVAALITFIVFTYPTLSWSLQDQIREYWPIFGNVYFDNRLYSAFSFINQNFPPKSVTLSTFYTGNYLPTFTHTVSFVGHFGYTYNIEEKQVQVRKFFENKMQEEEAKEFLLNNKIALIFQGPEEKPIYNNYLYPTLLKPVYDREEVTIYTSYLLK